jgi:hypothetical protein
MVVTFNIVLQSDDGWLLRKVCGYLYGPLHSNLNRWRDVYADTSLSIQCVPQDSETVFVTVTTSNTFGSLNLLREVVQKLYTAAGVMQTRFESESEIVIVCRANSKRTTTVYQQGVCTSCTEVSELESSSYTMAANDFPSL